MNPEFKENVKILVVEDTPATIRMLFDMLHEVGYHVLAAATGKQAIEIAKLEQPELILLDIMMPGMDGYETCQQLKTCETTKDIPIIFLSALTETFDKIKGFRLGAVDYVTKPIKREELLARAQTHVRLYRLQRELHALNVTLEAQVVARTEELSKVNESVQDIIYAQNAVGRITFISGAVEQLTGRMKEALIGKSMLEFGKILGHSAETVHQRIAEFEEAVKKGQNTIRYEFSLIAQNERRCFESLEKIHYDQDGNFAGTAGVMRDITDRKQMEESLRHSEEKFRQFFENEPEYCYMISPEGNILDINAAALKILGYQREEIVGKSLKTIYAPEAWPKMEQLFVTWKETGQLRDEELVIVTKTGDKRTVLLSAGVVKDQDEQILYSVSVQRDITDRKRMEEALRCSNAILSAVRHCAEQVLKGGNWEGSAQDMLEWLGRAAQVSRVYIFENHIGADGVLLTSQRYEWVAPGIAPQIENPALQGLPWQASGFGRWVGILGRGEKVIGHVKEFPASEQINLLSQGIQSIVVVPIFVGSVWWGFLGFDECLAEREWSQSESDALGAAAHTIGVAIERERTEKEIRKFKTISDRANYGNAIVDLTGNFIYVNDTFANMHGYLPNELIGQHLSELHTPEQLLHVNRLLDKLHQEGCFTTEEVWHKKRDGHTFPTLMNATVIEDDKGTPLFLSATTIDISDQKQAEESLRTLVTAVETMPLGLTITDLGGKIIYVNPAEAAIHGYRVEELLGKTPAIFAPPEQRKLFDLEEIIQWKGLVRERPNIRKDGSRFPVRLMSEIVKDQKGEPYAIVTSCEDITEQKKAEKALRISEQRLRATLENTPNVAVQWYDAQGRVLYWNPASEKLYGWSAAEAIGKTLDTLILAPDETAVFVELLQQTQLSGKAQPPCELCFHRRDGRAGVILSTVFPIPSEGNQNLFVCMDVDVTERKRAEEALQEMNTHLEATLDALPDLLFEIDRDGRIYDFRAPHPELLYTTPEKFLGKTIYEVLPNDAAHIIETAFVQALETGSQAGIEYALPMPQGLCWFELSMAVKGDPKSPEARFVCLIRDNTARKQAEQALKASEQRYRLLAEHVAEGILILQDGRLVFVNPSLLSMFRYSSEQLLQMSPVDLLRDDYKRAGRERLQQAEKGILDDRWQAPCLTGDGREIWVDLRASFIEWEDKPAVLLTGLDITEQKLREIVSEAEKEHLKKITATLTSTMKDRYRFGDLIGKSAVMQDVYELILDAAASDANVVITGDSGTGKELVAWTIHQMSARGDKAFVPVNCGAIPETLFESEFFGHRKGAFTGAHKDKPGLFDHAHGGTLFLDEVGELDPTLQVKLLRAIADGGHTPIGDHAVRKTDVRIISATNKNLTDMVTRGMMREDFYYRINVILITLPPLRERKEDLPLLIDHFLKQLGQQATLQTLPGKILKALYDYHWPGNIRELQNVLRRYVTTGRLDFIAPHEERTQVSPRDLGSPGAEVLQEGGAFQKAVETFEKQLIQRALEQNHWHRVKTAASLNISRRSLFRKMEKYGLS